MSMNFYIEILSPRVPALPGRENKRGDLWRHNDVRYCNAREVTNLFDHFDSFKIKFPFKALVLSNIFSFSDCVYFNLKII